VTPVSVPVLEALKQLERGEVHLSLTNDPDRELELERQGWAHTRTLVGGGGFVVVGPASAARGLKEVIAAKRDAGGSMMIDLMRAIAKQGVLFLSRPDGSATHRFEELMWGVAKIKPEGAWYRRANGDVPHWLHAKDMGACAVVEKGVWAQLGQRSGLTVLADKDPALNIDIHLMRSFRIKHPGSRLFQDWLTGPAGQWVISRRTGYRSISQTRAFAL
jgi:tungstate transport system substrate-binding protein